MAAVTDSLELMVAVDHVRGRGHVIEIGDDRDRRVAELLGERAAQGGVDDRHVTAPQERKCQIARVHRGAGSRGQGDRGDENAPRFRCGHDRHAGLGAGIACTAAVSFSTNERKCGS